MKCPRCYKHRVRTKETKPHGFTFRPLKVRYCIGCGWEKVESPDEPYYDYSLPPCKPDCPVCADNGVVLKDALEFMWKCDKEGRVVVDTENGAGLDKVLENMRAKLDNEVGIPADMMRGMTDVASSKRCMEASVEADLQALESGYLELEEQSQPKRGFWGRLKDKVFGKERK